MFSLRAGQTLLGLIRSHAKAQRRSRYCYWLGLALAAAIVVGSGVGLTRAMRDTSSPSVTSVPAASFERDVPMSMDSIAAGYGLNLATGYASADRDYDPDLPGIQLPKELAGTTVKVNGIPAGLFFVSPLQVNFVIPEGVMPEGADKAQVPVVITSGDGTISTGSIQIARVSPALFTANSNGRGVPAALLYRLKQNGEPSYETISERPTPGGPAVAKPIELGPEGEKVFLILYANGVRHAAKQNVRVLIGGIECLPTYADKDPTFVAVDQINVEIPRELKGRTVDVSVTVGGASSNLVNIEIAGDGGSSGPRVIGFGDPQALAGTPMIIHGSGFSTVKEENIVRIAGRDADVMEAALTRLTVMVPFGVETGTVRVITPAGEGISDKMLPVRTSVSGVVEDTSRQPLEGMLVKIPGSNFLDQIDRWDTTDREGNFVLHDIPETGFYTVEFDGGSIIVDPPIPKDTRKIHVGLFRDNAFPGPIRMTPQTGSSAVVGASSSLEGDGSFRSMSPQVRLGPEPITIDTEGFKLLVQGSTTATIPDTPTPNGIRIFVTPLKDASTPVELPLGYFSSSIVQITPFNVTLNPGAQLVFPNKDRLTVGEPVVLFRYDPDRGKFVRDPAKAFVSADGERIETELGAIKTTSYYFASRERDQMTVIRGYVFENDRKTPVVRAQARFRGQEAYTDGAGSYILRYVPVKAGEPIAVEVNVIRPSGRVDRETSKEVMARPGDTTEAPDVFMPDVKVNRPPTIIGPKRIEMNEAATPRDFKLAVTDPDPNQNLQVRVTVEPKPLEPFATIIRGGSIGSTGSSPSSTWTLRLYPGYNDAGSYTLELTATDGAGGKNTQNIEVKINNTNRAPSAKGQALIVNEDTAGTISLTGSDPDGESLSFEIVDQPLNGKLSGAAPDMTYMPNPNFAGSDRFTFKASDGDLKSIAATVTITVRAVNDPPVLLVPGPQTVSEGQAIDLTISASDPDAGQKLEITPTGLPAGASFIRTSATSGQFRWIPAFSQAGSYTVSFRVTDDAIPPLSDRKDVRFTVTDVALFTAPAPRKINEGQTLTVDIAPTGGLPVPVTLTAIDLPPGAALQEQGQNLVAGGVRLRWTPGFIQAGVYSIGIKATIASQPDVSEIRQMQIKVFDSQHDFAEDPADLTVNGIPNVISPLRGGGAGSSMAAGDLDGDGIDDLAVGAPSDNGAGQVHVFLGRANPKGVVDLANKPADLTIRGEVVDDLFGSSVAIGDINGDGKSDLIVGAPGAEASSNAPDSGKVYAVFGALAQGAHDIGKIASLMIVGAARDDRLGASVAVGKIGGPAAPESLIIGAPLCDVPGANASLPNAGCVYGFFGGTSLSGVRDLSAWPADFTIAGVVANGQFGYSIATGDFDADNLADMAIGAPAADSVALKAAGVVYLVQGSQSLKGAISPFQMFVGADSGDAAGSSVALGDLNSDGRADLIIGAPGADGPNKHRPDSGEVYILFGMPAIQGIPTQMTIFGSVANADAFPDGLGYSVAAGDFTGDGIPDLIMGAPGADSPDSLRQGVGAAYMIFGGRKFTAGTFDLTSDTPDLKLFGAKPGDRLGAGGFVFGKLDLTGANDLAIGIPAALKAENASIGAGEVRVLRGVVR